MTSTTETRVERPISVAEAARLLKETRGSVLIRGGGTKAAWAGRPRHVDLVMETGGLQRLITHNPADMTATVEAGRPLRSLQEELAQAGQWLALDPPTETAGATVGGLLATGDSGPRRLRYGALRDLVIGVTLVLPDGIVAKAGGQVIKNVAGYDVSKLMYGSLGTLALIAEVVFRVHPRPEASATIVVPADVPTAAAGSLGLLASALEPAAVDWVGDPRQPAGLLAVRFEGSAAGVAAQTAALRHVVAGAGGVEPLADAGERDLWEQFATAHRGAPGQAVAFAGTLPSRLPAVADALTAAADESGADVQLASQSALGLHTAVFSGPVDAQAQAVDAWRRAVMALGGTVLMRDRPDDLDGLVDPLGPPPSSVNLLRALKSRLDPARRLAPGRLGTWLSNHRGEEQR